MFRKIIIPILLIISSTLFSVFYSNKFENCDSFMFVVMNTTLCSISLYTISKFIIDKSKLKYDSFSKMEKTIDMLIFSSLLVGALSGYFMTTIWTKQYYDSQLSKYGVVTKGYIVSTKSIGKRGTVFVYEYFDKKSVKYQNTINEDYLHIGDSLQVYYSSENPDINIAIKL